MFRSDGENLGVESAGLSTSLQWAPVYYIHTYAVTLWQTLSILKIFAISCNRSIVIGFLKETQRRKKRKKRDSRLIWFDTETAFSLII